MISKGGRGWELNLGPGWVYVGKKTKNRNA